MEETGLREPPRSTEAVIGKYIVHFEPGMHSFPFADIVLGHPTTQQLKDRFDAGDLTAHAWNPQVAERTRQYSPFVIGLDSVPGHYIRPLDPYSWIWLPGSPKEMTGKDEVFLVGGDLLHFQILDPLSGVPEDYATWKGELSKIGWEEVKKYFQGTIAKELPAVHIVLPIALSIANRMLSQRNNQQESNVPNPGRRLFLKKATAALAALSFATLLPRLTPLAQSYSPTPSTEDVAQKITDLAKPWTGSKWLEGRTAMVIAKTAEVMERLGLPQGSQGSVVMGWPHAYEAGSFMTDKHARMKAIREYAQEFFNYVYPTVPDSLWELAAIMEINENELKVSSDAIKTKTDEIKNRGQEWKRGYLMDALLPFFTATVVYKIKEPHFKPGDNPNDAIKDIVVSAEWFPSKEVKETVAPLGNPERFQFEVKSYL